MKNSVFILLLIISSYLGLQTIRAYEDNRKLMNKLTEAQSQLKRMEATNLSNHIEIEKVQAQCLNTCIDYNQILCLP